MSSSKYAWHPPHRPPPAEPSIAGRIAMIGPIGKCLETALDELLADDDDEEVMLGAKKNCGSHHGNAMSNESTSTATSNGRLNKKRKHSTETTIANSQECEIGGSAREQSNQDINASRSELTPDNNLILDSSMSKSILEAYSKAVSETKFDHERKPNSSTTPANSTTTGDAPAAMLKGEIDHFNRVGGQWRIVVKNAVLKQRSTTKIENGMAGQSLRKRMVLDWDNGGEARKKSAPSASDSNLGCDNNSSSLHDVHHFQGTIQILAYDDDS